MTAPLLGNFSQLLVLQQRLLAFAVGLKEDHDSIDLMPTPVGDAARPERPREYLRGSGPQPRSR